MQLYLHPTRHEALAASTTALTRWPLDTNPATILAQMPTDPASLFSLSYDQGGRLHTCGGVTGSPDEVLFAHKHLIPQEPRYWGVISVIDWRRWDDFSLARIGSEPYPSHGISSLASSPDGRWLVVGVWHPWRLFLLDWQTGELMSHHAIAGVPRPWRLIPRPPTSQASRATITGAIAASGDWIQQRGRTCAHRGRSGGHRRNRPIRSAAAWP